VFSGDRDLWQLIGPRTSVFNPIKRDIVTKDDVYQAFQVSPEQIALHKTLFGDSGDCVPNVMPRMQKQLLPLVRETATGDFEEFKERVRTSWTKLTPRCRELYETGAAQLETNRQLVYLDAHCKNLVWG